MNDPSCRGPGQRFPARGSLRPVEWPGCAEGFILGAWGARCLTEKPGPYSALLSSESPNVPR